MAVGRKMTGSERCRDEPGETRREGGRGGKRGRREGKGRGGVGGGPGPFRRDCAERGKRNFIPYPLQLSWCFRAGAIC